jgi:GntR family transcriptional repressor for pyruvate dehydrogenase complex
MMLFGLADARERLYEQHKAIHEAIVTRSPEPAAQAARAHIGYVASALSEAEFARDREVAAARRLVQFEQARRAGPPRRKRSA